jgi:hypothetical protein
LTTLQAGEHHKSLGPDDGVVFYLPVNLGVEFKARVTRWAAESDAMDRRIGLARPGEFEALSSTVGTTRRSKPFQEGLRLTELNLAAG